MRIENTGVRKESYLIDNLALTLLMDMRRACRPDEVVYIDGNGIPKIRKKTKAEIIIERITQ